MRFPPVGLSEILDVYGDPRELLDETGTVSAQWEREKLTLVTLPAALTLGWDKGKSVTRIRVHKLAQEAFEDAFDKVFMRDLWPNLKTFDGTVAYRSVRGHGSRLSTHAWGIAIDLNAATNKLGEKGDMDEGIVRCFEDAGFKWGGDFARTDPMHFQLARGY